MQNETASKDMGELEQDFLDNVMTRAMCKEYELFRAAFCKTALYPILLQRYQSAESVNMERLEACLMECWKGFSQEFMEEEMERFKDECRDRGF